MEKAILDNITQTIEGYEVKNLTWLERDNVIRGQVKCPIVGREKLHEGFIIVTWRKNGKVMPKWGENRNDLNIEINS